MTVNHDSKPPASIASSIEAKFAQRLAANEKKVRDRTFKKLRQYMLARSIRPDGGFARDELIKIWKGLFYCMWMCDKPVVQEELAHAIANLLPMLRNIKTSMLYFDTFLTTIHREWMGIDRLRMDKFFLLFRFMLQNAFVCLKNNKWDDSVIDWLMSILKNGPLNPTAPGPGVSRGPPLGIRFHTLDVYIEELSSCADSSLPAEKILRLLLPFFRLVCCTPVGELRDMALEKIFQEVIDRSEPAQMLIKEATKDEEDDDDDDESDCQQLNFDYSAIADKLFEMANKSETLARNRKKVYKMVQKLRGVAEGQLPLDDFPDLLPDDEDDPKGEKDEEELFGKLSADWEQAFQQQRKEKKEMAKGKRKKKRLEDAELGEGDPSELLNLDTSAANNVADDTPAPSSSDKTKAQKKSKKSRDVVDSETTSDPENVLVGSNISMDEMQDDDVCDDVNNSLAELSEGSGASAGRNVSISGDVAEQQCVVAKKVKSSKKRKVQKTKQLESNDDFDPSQDPDVVTKKRKKTPKITKRKQMIDLLISDSDQPSSQDNEVASSELSTVAEKSASVAKIVGDDAAADPVAQQGSSKLPAQGLDASKEKKLSRKATARKSAVDNTPTKNAADQGFAEFSEVLDQPKSAFLRFAASKVTKAKSATEPRKRKPETARTRSAKRVSFEMSKIQVKPFRKNEKSSAVSPSPFTVPFDPNKTPDFGLLKRKRTKQKKN